MKCSKCRGKNDRIPQRYCSICHAIAQRNYRNPHRLDFLQFNTGIVIAQIMTWMEKNKDHPVLCMAGARAALAIGALAKAPEDPRLQRRARVDVKVLQFVAQR